MSLTLVSMLMDGTCKTKIQIAIIHGISGGGGPYPQPPLLENSVLWTLSSYSFAFKMANKQKISLEPRSWKKKLWIRAWLVFALGLMQVNNLTLGCNSILY